MPPLSQTSRTALRRAWTRHSLPSQSNASSRIIPPTSVTAVATRQQLQQQRHATSTVKSDPTFNSPIPDTEQRTTDIPNFKKYMSKKGESSNKTFSYFMVGAYGLITGVAAKNTIGGASITHAPRDDMGRGGFRGERAKEWNREC